MADDVGDVADLGGVCTANIGPKQRRLRMVSAVVSAVVGVVSAAALVLSDAALGWRVALFLPFWSAGVGYFQAREKT